MATVRRFLPPPPGSVFLFGPRGTGKSTWLQQVCPEALRLDLLAPEVLRTYQARPERRALKTLVAQHLRALCQLRAGGAQLSFWRTRAGLEVNVIVYGPNLFLAIEVKRSRRVERSDRKALRAFGEDDPEAERLLLSFCSESLLIDGIRCEPLEPWLRQLRP